MTLDQVPAGARMLVDSNVLVYHFQPHPLFGPMCNRLMERIERQDIEAFTFTSLLSEVAHRRLEFGPQALSAIEGVSVRRLRQQISGQVSHVRHVDESFGRDLRRLLYGVPWTPEPEIILGERLLA